MRQKMDRMQREVNEFMAYVKREMTRGVGDWEERLGTALVKAPPATRVRAVPRPPAPRDPRRVSPPLASAARPPIERSAVARRGIL